MEFKQRTLKELADMICSNYEAAKSFFRYRSSSYLTDFFAIVIPIINMMVQLANLGGGCSIASKIIITVRL